MGAGLSIAGRQWGYQTRVAAPQTSPAPSAANSVPQNAGWYTSDPFSADNTAESLSGLVNRVDSGATPGYTTTPATVGSAGAQYGIWCAHLVLNTTDAITFGPNGNLQFFPVPASGEVHMFCDTVLAQAFSTADTLVLPGHGDWTTIGTERPNLETWVERGW
jgi:hypothetical protein